MIFQYRFYESMFEFSPLIRYKIFDDEWESKTFNSRYKVNQTDDINTYNIDRLKDNCSLNWERFGKNEHWWDVILSITKDINNQSLLATRLTWNSSAGYIN